MQPLTCGCVPQAEGRELIERRAAERVWSDHLKDYLVRLETQIGGVKTELKADIGGVKSDLKDAETRLEKRMTVREVCGLTGEHGEALMTALGSSPSCGHTLMTDTEHGSLLEQDALAFKIVSIACAAVAAVVTGLDYIDKRIMIQPKATQK